MYSRAPKTIRPDANNLSTHSFKLGEFSTFIARLLLHRLIWHMVFSPFDSLSTFCVHVQIHVHQRATEVTCISGTLVKLYYLSSSRQDKFADKMGFAEMFPTHMVRIHQIISEKHSFIPCKFALIDFIDPSARFRLQDFEGQGRAERISRYIITLFGVVGLIWGAFIQQFSQTVYILVAGVLLTLIVSIVFIVFLLLQRLSLSFNFW